MIMYILSPENPSKNEKGRWKTKYFGYSGFFLFGTLYLHTGISWLTGQWTYIDWRFQLPSVILIILVGIIHIIGFMLLKPRIFDLIYCIISVGILLILIYIILPIVVDLIIWTIIALATVIILQWIYPFLRMKIRMSERTWLNKRLWKKSVNLNKKSWMVFNWVLWGFLTAESLFKLSGLSLFLWW
jgi:hypothetical protein